MDAISIAAVTVALLAVAATLYAARQGRLGSSSARSAAYTAVWEALEAAHATARADAVDRARLEARLRAARVATMRGARLIDRSDRAAAEAWLDALTAFAAELARLPESEMPLRSLEITVANPALPRHLAPALRRLDAARDSVRSRFGGIAARTV